jgi:hypothetical protein
MASAAPLSGINPSGRQPRNINASTHWWVIGASRDVLHTSLKGSLGMYTGGRR